MIENPQNTCMSCFTQHAMPTNPCPVCGYNETAQEMPPHLLRPRTILNGKYLLGKVLGQGGFGITYIGWDLNLGIKVAVKEYYPSGFVSRETTSVGNATVQPFTGSQGEFFIQGREKFINEARTLAKFFALPGIVSIKDFFQENGTAYISMEYIDGQTLKDYLAQMGGRLNAAQVFEMMKPVMYSLAEVHKAGLIHRDISPDNIMISKEGQMKLLDFGAARDFSGSGNQSMSIMLKPGFAPEEQYRSRGVQGPWTDVYALSATIYKCITGVTPEESVERVRTDNVRPPSMLGFPLEPAKEAALMRGMAVLQEYRFQNVTELYYALYEPQPQPSVAAAPAPAPSVTAPVSNTSQQYQQPQQQYQPLQNQQYQQQPHHGHQQPQPFVQEPQKINEVYGWSKVRNVLAVILFVGALLVIIYGILSLSGFSFGTPENNNDVIVTASPTVQPNPTPEQTPEPTSEPAPIPSGIDGTWVTQEQDFATEFAFDNTSSRFYMVYFESPEDNPNSFIVVEGTFSVSGDNLMITSTWGVISYDGINTAAEIDNEQWSFTFNLSGQTLTIYDEDGLPEVYTGGQTLGVWSFNHRDTTVFSDEDVPGSDDDYEYYPGTSIRTFTDVTGVPEHDSPNQYRYSESTFNQYREYLMSIGFILTEEMQEGRMTYYTYHRDNERVRLSHGTALTFVRLS